MMDIQKEPNSDLVNFQKESEAFDSWHYQDWRSNISTDIDESEYPELYRRIYSHFSAQCERELQFKTWLAAKAQAVPEGFVLVPKEPTEKMMINALAVIATGIGKDHIDVEIIKIWQKMIEAAEDKSL
ncbi:hypothetical protein RFH42_03295 [Acinetobacter rudis]|uniref:hypothetical protein n=1 Tax=Acinetobacter rudis TaxID=632955 RepID=UPI00280D7E57|nr:hypothetical protein [Acinetobacter rudis]MDQ8951979.1 hypothetical protein [Acinetobacter rudis]